MKMLLRSFCVCVMALLLAQPASARVTDWQQAPHSAIRLVVADYSPGHSDIALEFKIDDGWKMYWRHPGDAGFPPTISVSGENIENSSVKWPYPERAVDSQGGITLESYAYHRHLFLPLEIKAKDASQPLKGEIDISYGICKDICIPAHAKITLDVASGEVDHDAAALFEQAMQAIPQANGSHGLQIHTENVRWSGEGDTLKLAVEVSSSVRLSEDADLFVEGGDDFAFYKPRVTFLDDMHDRAQFVFPVKAFGEKKLGTVALHLTFASGGEAVEAALPAGTVHYDARFAEHSREISSASNDATSGTSHTWFVILLFAWLGGLILNVMPCVLPVLSIKLLGVIRHGSGETSWHVRLSFLSAAIGIVVSFMVLATVVVVLKNAGMAVGWGFHFQQPYFLVVMVLILTLFAQNMWGLFEIKLPMALQDRVGRAGIHHQGLAGHFLSGALATILATPCTAPFLGTAVGFALSRGPFEIFSTFLAMSLGMATPYLLVTWRPQWVMHLPKSGNWMVAVKALMGILLVLTAAWLIWVLSGQLGAAAARVMAAWVVALTIFQIPGFVSRNFLKRLLVGFVMLNIITLPSFFPAVAPKKQEEIGWQAFDESRIAPLVAEGKVVLVDVTADWCLTCKFNEINVLHDDEVRARLSDGGIVAMRADWTSRNPEILQYLQAHGRLGIPFNIVYGPAHPEGIVLSELLTKSALFEALEKASGTK